MTNDDPKGVYPQSLDGLKEPRIGRLRDGDVSPVYPVTRILTEDAYAAEEAFAAAASQVEEARAEAGRLLADAQSRASTIEREAYEVGEKAGAVRFAKMLDHVTQDLRRFRANAEDHIKITALQLAQGILKTELKTHPETIVELTKYVLGHTNVHGDVRIIVSVEDLNTLQRSHKSLVESLTHGSELALRGGQDLPAGSVRVETSMGAYDGSIEAIVEELCNRAVGDRPSSDGFDAGQP